MENTKWYQKKSFTFLTFLNLFLNMGTLFFMLSPKSLNFFVKKITKNKQKTEKKEEKEETVDQNDD